MTFAHGVSTRSQGNGFLIVHRHAFKGFAHLQRGFQRIGLTVHALWIDVDQAHLHRRQWIFHGFRIAHIGIAIFGRREPFFFRAPVGVFFGLPNVLTTESKTKGFQTHAFIRHRACQSE